MYSFLLKYILRAICYHVLPQKKMQQRPSESQQIKFRSQAHVTKNYWKKFTNLPLPKESIPITWSLVQFGGYKETDNIKLETVGVKKGNGQWGKQNNPKKTRNKTPSGITTSL